MTNFNLKHGKPDAFCFDKFHKENFTGKFQFIIIFVTSILDLESELELPPKNKSRFKTN